MSQIEAGLLEQARSGNRDALDLLVGRLIEPAYRLAFGMLHDREAAEDAVQEATFKAWTRLENVRPGWSIRPWFFGIVANQCRTIRRGRWWSVVKIAAPWLAMPSPEDQSYAAPTCAELCAPCPPTACSSSCSTTTS